MTNNQLQQIISRIEKLEDEKSAISLDIKEVYGEAKSMGFDPKIIRKVVSIRAKDAAKRAEEEALLDTYMAALGMLADTPLGQAAIQRGME
ncbi:Azospirillum phage Cd, Gp10 [uncultured Caudovirales phage]|uniref:Azospirillum phage Cd, Gp10 n=1 Tax=uncultured Caudovirales phage TaxID=2100421 RepID=A0A6J7WF06_9CAUD|nr:Azospirillum phage Cd, Gp10 [uncultured Caudovirales phage]